jgi:hypothetical protein
VDGSRSADNLLAHRGQHNATLTAVEQHHAQSIFQFPDLSAERGLPNVTDFSGMREVSLVRKSDEITQFL